MDDISSIQFGIYIALAFVLYAIRRALRLPKRYLPLLAIVLGIIFSWIQAGNLDYNALLRGIQYALYGVGMIESIRTTFTKSKEKEPDQSNH
ncbi:MAG: hypothetical protein ACO1OC_03935 [Tuberibacillus sp.]